MDFLTEDEIAALRIEQLIFHVVQHEDSEPILLNETPIGKFEGFFLDRVKETLKGNHYEFVEGSSTLQLLNEISEDTRKFVPNSKQLAINFHASRNKIIKPGAVILIRLFAGPKELFSLIKYDHEQVLAYNLTSDSRAILEEIVHNFTKSKKALQKSALIQLTDKGGSLIVVDNTVAYDITDFFRAFLNVRRVYSESDMTNVVNNVILETALKHKDKLPREITEKMRSISFHAIQELDFFDQREFFDKVFGAHATPRLYKTYETLLRKNNIDGDSFRFIKDAIKPQKETKYRTREGVRITYSAKAAETVHITLGKENRATVITITTQQLFEE